MLQSRLTVLALAALTLVVAGCGKSAKSASQATQSAKTETAKTATTGPALTRAVFVSKADAVCRQLQREQSHLTLRTKGELASVGAKVRAYGAEALAELGRLVPPASLAGEWRQTVADARVLAVDTAKIVESLQAGSTASASSRRLIADAATVRTRVLAAAKREGLHDCALTI